MKRHQWLCAAVLAAGSFFLATPNAQAEDAKPEQVKELIEKIKAHRKAKAEKKEAEDKRRREEWERRRRQRGNRR